MKELDLSFVQRCGSGTVHRLVPGERQTRCGKRVTRWWIDRELTRKPGVGNQWKPCAACEEAHVEAERQARLAEYIPEPSHDRVVIHGRVYWREVYF